MFERILIANRGEIACRIARTARRLGISVVAVYSDADEGALHVALADEAHYIGPAPARASYLEMDRILAAARASGAEAVHPGYGFLSENAEFAAACRAAGLVFIGPPPEAIRAMGSKAAAKRLLEPAGVPIMPGYHGEDQTPETLSRAAREIGFPVLIKAAAGGGGRGMRVVEAPEGFDDALAAAQREAKAAFGDETVILEKYLPRARHIEVQIFADGHGNLIHLYERDCSVQRRHQKVIEEAPAPGMTPALRAGMASAACAAAKAIGYVGAGTVEFLVEADRMGEPDCFYFMEMNTRLQVEHPVTEMITGLDLVEWQFRVAAGEALPLAQDDIAIDGHAIEARLYAEDPERDFLPAPGRLRHLRLPEETSHLRVDTGVREGDQVPLHYDPMVAKLIAWDRDRRGAIQRLRRALGATRVVGTATNVTFLAAALAHPVFAGGEFDTGFIERHRADLVPERRTAPREIVALAALAELLRREEKARGEARASGDPYSPWARTDGWRLNDRGRIDLVFLDGKARIPIVVRFAERGFLLDLPDGPMRARGEFDEDGTLRADLDGRRVAASVVAEGSNRHVFTPSRNHCLVLHDPLAGRGAHGASGGRLTAPMPGRIISVDVTEGETVRAGQRLMVLEAMKMEHVIAAPATGTVETIHFAVGEQVSEGAELIAFAVAQE